MDASAMSDDLVMRSIYLPAGLDSKLRQLSAELGRSRSDLIREYASAGVEHTLYNQPGIALDCVVFDDAGRLLTVERKHPPFQGQRSLPGGFLENGETAEQGAARELLEETGLVAVTLRLIGVYSAPDRDPRKHVISIAYLVTVTHYNPEAGDDAAAAEFLHCHTGLAFDHDKIVSDAQLMRIERATLETYERGEALLRNRQPRFSKRS